MSGNIMILENRENAEMRFYTNGAERLQISNNGNLEFKSTTSSFTGASSFTNHTNGYLYLRGGTSGLRLDDDGSVNTIQIVDGSSGYIKFETGDGSERMRITSAGNIEMRGAANVRLDIGSQGTPNNNSGNWMYANGTKLRFNNAGGGYLFESLGGSAVTISSAGSISLPAGQGISFAATADASGMSSEILDDYEEGTWTPAFGGTLSTAVGHYTKIGNQVTIYYHLVSTGGLPSGASQVIITGLPFTSNSGSLVAAPIYARYYTPNDSTLTSLIQDNESQIRLMNINEGNFDYTIMGELEASHNNSIYIIGSATYMV